jgi:predicted ribonuclease YlaK
MPRARKSRSAQQPVANGYNRKQMKRRKPISAEYIETIEPLTPRQEQFFEEYGKGQNIYAYGCAGTGKTFLALYLALREILDEYSNYEKLYIVRSLVATREIGFLPGTHEDKADIYQIPYKNMVRNMFDFSTDSDYDSLYDNLKAQETISFWSTSFLRGTTLDNAIIIVDECQNLNFHELDSIITRVGQDSKIIFCGDARQSDLIKTNERTGIVDFQRILDNMDEFSLIEFGVEDIVRSGLVKSYLLSKISLGM